MTAMSWLHHLGLLAAYLRDGGISPELYHADLGDGFAPDARTAPSLSSAKAALQAYAAATFTPGHPPIATALSGYGWVRYWLSLTDFCRDG